MSTTSSPDLEPAQENSLREITFTVSMAFAVLGTFAMFTYLLNALHDDTLTSGWFPAVPEKVQSALVVALVVAAAVMVTAAVRRKPWPVVLPIMVAAIGLSTVAIKVNDVLVSVGEHNTAFAITSAKTESVLAGIKETYGVTMETFGTPDRPVEVIVNGKPSACYVDSTAGPKLMCADVHQFIEIPGQAKR